MMTMIMTFLGGFISFFSPCILPILPLYFTYLSSSSKIVKEDGTVTYHQKKVFLYTLMFISGIATSFFLLGFSFTLIGKVFESSRYYIALISGIVIIVFGLVQLGIIRLKKLNLEKRIVFSKLSLQKMNLFSAYLLGFGFSFAWTPCVGPTLSSVLLLVANSSFIMGFGYILLYALGFIIPFIIIGFATTPVLNLLKTKQRYFQKALRLVGVILLVIGLNLVFSNGKLLFQSYHYEKLDTSIDHVFMDVTGADHNLVEYHGKTVVLAFLDRFCSACQEEMVLLNSLVKEGLNDVVVLGVMKQNTVSDDEKKAIKDFIKQKDYHFDIIFDDDSILETTYQVRYYPTTLIFDKNGKKVATMQGLFSKEIFNEKLELSRCEKNHC